MTLDDIFSRPYLRRMAILLLSLIAVLLVVVRYFTIPSFDPRLSATVWQALAKIVEDLSTSITVTLFIALIVLMLTPTSIAKARISVLDASELKGEFSDGLNQSDSWLFYGGCGRYFRSEVLKKMSQRATAESSTKAMRGIILNPGNEALCEQHSRYRAATRQGRRDAVWSPSRVKCELLATIILCLREGQQNGLLDIRLYLSNRFSTFRADISELSAIETREDPKAPALKSPSDSDFYKALRTEFDVLAQQSQEVIDQTRICSTVRDQATLENAVRTLSIPGVVVTAIEYQQIWTFIKEQKDPHA